MLARLALALALAGSSSGPAAATPVVTETIGVGDSPIGVAVSPDGTRAYVTNDGDGTVSVIDTSTNTVIDTIPVGSNPRGVAVSPDGTRAYVTNDGDGTVSVIDTSTNTVIDTIPVGSNPRGVAVSPDGTRAYVTNGTPPNPLVAGSGSGQLSVIDTTIGAVTATTDVGAFPSLVAISPSGQSVYVINQRSPIIFIGVLGISRLSVIDTTTGAVTATTDVGDSPSGLAVSPDGSRAFVATAGDNRVSVIDTSTNTVIDTIPVGSNPRGLAVSPDGIRAYTTNSSDNTVSVIDTSTNTVIDAIPVGFNPRAVAVSPDSKNGYVTNLDDNSVSVLALRPPVFTAAPDPVGFADQRIGTTSAAQTVTVTNTGSSDLTFGPAAVTLAGANPGQFSIDTDGCSNSDVPAGDTCTVDVIFSPVTTGDKTATLRFATNAASSPNTVDLSGTGVEPVFTAAPDPVGFADQRIGTTSAAQTVTVTNTGSSDLTFGPAAVTLAGANPGQFSIDTDGCSNSDVPAGDTCTVDVIFSPVTTGDKTATLRFATNAASSPNTVDLSGTGVEPVFTAAPDPVGFADQRIGTTSAAQTVTVTNTGSSDLTFGPAAVTLAGANPGQFSIDTDGCSNSDVPAGDTCTVDVIFSPVTTGDKTATLRFATNAASSPNTVDLSGTGVEPVFTAAPDPVGFADQRIGTTSAAQTVTVTNTGSSDLTFGPAAVTLAGANPGQFSIDTDGCSNSDVPAGDTCTVDVIFSPVTTGDKTATLRFATNAASSPNTVDLSGTGVEPVFTAAPDPVGFADQRIGTTSAAQTVTVTNTGSSDLTFGPAAVTLAGANPGQFSIDTDGCSTTTVAPNATCTVGVSFAPATAGDMTATLRFATNTSSSPNTVGLSGIGVAEAVSPPVSTPVGLKAQFPANKKGKPPKRIRRAGTTVITGKNARTNAGQRIRTRVSARPIGTTAAGEVNYFKTIRGKQGKVSIRTYGYKRLKVVVVQRAKATPGYKPYKLRTVYRNGKRR